MFDIHFYINSYNTVKRLMNGEKLDFESTYNLFEKLRNREPVVYNIETTNACNMRCKMCPRTRKMTRDITTINRDLFIKILDQIRPWANEEWNKWEDFCTSTYGIKNNDMSENHFFLYVIPKIIQLHGYGDPLLDKNMPEYVRLLNNRGFYSYFSCNPANINIDKTVEMFDNGLDYIKYSIESVDDKLHKEIRGDKSNFTQSYKNILKLLDIKEKNNYKTTIVITMLDLNNPNQQEEYKKLEESFKDLDVYIYLKSEDQQWYRKDYHGTKSIHWSEICKHPWMSLTVKSDGEVAMCMEDYNNEIILGDSKTESLYDIWNGKKYEKFRMDHFNVARGIKCSEECDMKLVGEYFK